MFQTTDIRKLEILQVSQEDLRQFPQFKSLFDVIDNAKLDKVVWKVIGGLPLRYFELITTLKLNNDKGL